jgi:hypothetical protein
LNFDRSERAAVAAQDAAVAPAQPQMIPGDILKGLAALARSETAPPRPTRKARRAANPQAAMPTSLASIR